jgi:multiple sugar transport system permease protein
LLLVLYIYNKGFNDFEMGYAALLAWVLFVIILALTLLNFRVARSWVFYEGELKG